MFSVPQYTSSELQQYNYFAMQEPVFEPEIEVPVFTHVYEENGVLYCASSTSEWFYCYTYVLNNPLRFVDPSGYSYLDFLNAEAQNDYNPQAAWWYDYMNTGAGAGRLKPDPGSHNNVGQYVRNPGPVGFAEDENGNQVTLNEDPVTGQAYYNVEYETDWYIEYTT